jgi:hypothetical protein
MKDFGKPIAATTAERVDYFLTSAVSGEAVDEAEHFFVKLFTAIHFHCRGFHKCDPSFHSNEIVSYIQNLLKNKNNLRDR